MKKLFTAMFLIAIIVIAGAPTRTFAQSDTLVVYAGGMETRTLDQIIGADTLAGGIQKHSAYELVSLDTTYLLDATITLKSGVSIIGVPDPSTGRLPCIQSDVIGSSQITGIQFTLTGQGKRYAMNNLYLLGVAPNGSVNTESGQGIQVSADSITLYVNNCVFDDFTQFDIGYNSSWDVFHVTNSKFRNGIELATAYYVPEALRNEYPGTFPTDSVVFKYNTFLCVAEGPVVAQAFIKYFEFNHNDMVVGSKAPLWTERLTTGKIENNIFYDTYGITENGTEYTGQWDEKGPTPRKPAVINYIPLDSITAALFMGKAITSAADSIAAEAARNVQVKNNAYFWTSDLTTLYKNWNDTAATTDSLYPPVFMNPQTAAMFGNSAYPNFAQSGNQNLDPGFGSGIGATLTGSSADGNGMLAWIIAIRKGQGTNEYFAYQRLDGTAVPTWPLPETSDLQYSNATVKSMSTDGLPEGDPYWFNGLTAVKAQPPAVPAKFDLSNNYPNPFNPSTDIKVSLSKAGVMSLRIYNVLGQLVKVVDQGYKPAGVYLYNVNMDNLASGVYFYSLQQGTNAITKKMLLLK